MENWERKRKKIYGVGSTTFSFSFSPVPKGKKKKKTHIDLISRKKNNSKKKTVRGGVEEEFYECDMIYLRVGELEKASESTLEIFRLHHIPS